jgi:quercetin dioxygenase-like cupin family protein
MSDQHKRVLDFTGSRAEKHFKATLFQEESLLLGINCLDPGQAQHVHSHADQAKFYYVVEGRGWFTVGDDEFAAEVGEVVWAGAGVPHGVENRADGRLTLLMGIAPSP